MFQIPNSLARNIRRKMPLTETMATIDGIILHLIRSCPTRTYSQLDEGGYGLLHSVISDGGCQVKLLIVKLLIVKTSYWNLAAIVVSNHIPIRKKEVQISGVLQNEPSSFSNFDGA